ncbi:MAG: AprI/Inh family metalloprotease inhibitor [Xanthobacteraceae bacterium]
MPSRAAFTSMVWLLMLASGEAAAQGPVGASETAKGMVGAWEISNSARDKICPLTFSVEPAPAGYKLELDSKCAAAFPSLKAIAAWVMGPNEQVRLIDAKGTVVLDFTEVESRMYEAERKGEGLFFMRTQAAIKAATVSPEQVFGDWTLLQEFEKPLCRLAFSNETVAGESYRITVKPGCAAEITGLGFSSWRLDNNELLLSGRGTTWRFSESDATLWERIPPSGEPMVLMRQ